MNKTYTVKVVAMIAKKSNKKPMTNNVTIRASGPQQAMDLARITYPYGAYNLYLIGEK